jgi:hypothetical protein
LFRLHWNYAVSHFAFNCTNHSYRQATFDDSLLLSVDFPRARPKDCFRIIPERDTFSLAGEKEPVCCGNGSAPGLAIAVSSHGVRDVIAILRRDGSYHIPADI